MAWIINSRSGSLGSVSPASQRATRKRLRPVAWATSLTERSPRSSVNKRATSGNAASCRSAWNGARRKRVSAAGTSTPARSATCRKRLAEDPTECINTSCRVYPAYFESSMGSVTCTESGLTSTAVAFVPLVPRNRDLLATFRTAVPTRALNVPGFLGSNRRLPASLIQRLRVTAGRHRPTSFGRARESGLSAARGSRRKQAAR